MNKCVECGKEDYSTSYTEGCPEKKKMDKENVCFKCAFWLVKIDGNNPLVIGGVRYSLGSGGNGGMGGRKFKIRYFDGREVESTDLWCQGQIPEIFRDRLPNTAEFGGGASSHKTADGGLCFSESR